MAKVYVSNVIPAAVGLVWAQVRNFNGLPDWTGFVAESRIEQNLPADKIGCIRNFRLRNGGRIRERLLALSDYEMSCTYAILESPMGVENYVATLRLIPITDGDQTFAEWSAEFDAAPERESAIADDIARNVFAAALASLKNLFVLKPHG
jgi:Polyketide cyclase / dehydrase and lipid transport